MAPRAARLLLLVAGSAVLAGCGRLDDLAYSPATTPEQWCEQRPCVEVAGTVMAEPLGTALVALLSLAWLAAGGYFLVTRSGQASRAWLGVALVLGGIGAGLAGISYQAFSYPLKCAGWDYCRLTNGFEVGYSVSQAASVSAMVVAVGYACAADRLRRGMAWYAAANVAVYLAVTAAGVLLPSATLLSFEVLMLFAVPGIVLVIVVGRRRGDAVGRRIVIAAVLLVAVQVAYFAYYASGLTAALWDDGQGFYFSANEILHVGMLGWLVYVVGALGPRLRDLTPAASPARPPAS